MTQGIGTGWMIPPKKRPDDDAAYNQLIDKMGIEEVRRMMCPKSYGNPEKCKKCDGFRTCKPGQRMARLITEQMEETERKTAPVFVQKWKEGEPEKPNNPTSAERDEFKQACESGNAWNWLMEHKGLSREAAGEVLSRMVKRYPGISADFGGSRRIMQRPRVVKIAPVEAQKGREQAHEPKVEETPAEDVKAAEQAVKTKSRRDEMNAQLAEEARERCRQILATGDPVQALVNEGKTEQQARARINKWRASYPDLFEGIDPAIYRAKRGRKKKEALMEQTEADQQIAEPAEVDDEVSLSDFLTEYGAEPQVPESDPEPRSERTGGAMDELEAKYNALEREKQEARERIRWIEEQQEALQKVISMFR